MESGEWLGVGSWWEYELRAWGNFVRIKSESGHGSSRIPRNVINTLDLHDETSKVRTNQIISSGTVLLIFVIKFRSNMSDSEESSNNSGSDSPNRSSAVESKKRAASLDAPPATKDDGNGFEDETLQCRDCGGDFIFSAEDQAFHASKGFENKPFRCADCRNSKKQRMNDGGGRGGRGGRFGGGGDRCYNCGGSGHMSRDCPEPRKEQSCYNCGKGGHMSRDCPEPRKERGGGGGGRGRGGGGRGRGGRGRGGGGGRY